MNKISLVLSAVVMVAMVIVVAPNIIALNRGKALRNIALWLAIFAVLGLVYQNFGPGGKYPLFAFPAGVTRPEAVPVVAPQNAKPENDQGFTPPRE